MPLLWAREAAQKQELRLAPCLQAVQEVKKAASSLQATSEVPSTPSLFVVLGGVNALFWHGL